MKFLEKWDSKIKNAPLSLLEEGFIQLSHKQVELEAELKSIIEAKARFMIEIDLRVNGKPNTGDSR